MVYEIWYNNSTILKTYPIKFQAIIWLFMNGFVLFGRGMYFVDPLIEIREKICNKKFT